MNFSNLKVWGFQRLEGLYRALLMLVFILVIYTLLVLVILVIYLHAS